MFVYFIIKVLERSPVPVSFFPINELPYNMLFRVINDIKQITREWVSRNGSMKYLAIVLCIGVKSYSISLMLLKLNIILGLYSTQV